MASARQYMTIYSDAEYANVFEGEFEGRWQKGILNEFAFQPLKIDPKTLEMKFTDKFAGKTGTMKPMEIKDLKNGTSDIAYFPFIGMLDFSIRIRINLEHWDEESFFGSEPEIDNSWKDKIDEDTGTNPNPSGGSSVSIYLVAAAALMGYMVLRTTAGRK